MINLRCLLVIVKKWQLFQQNEKPILNAYEHNEAE